MKRMEVRCCCQPQKLLGTLPVPDLTKPGSRVIFVMMKPPSRSIESIKASGKVMAAPRKVELPVETFTRHDWCASTRRALRSLAAGPLVPAIAEPLSMVNAAAYHGDIDGDLEP